MDLARPAVALIGQRRAAGAAEPANDARRRTIGLRRAGEGEALADETGPGRQRGTGLLAAVAAMAMRRPFRLARRPVTHGPAGAAAAVDRFLGRRPGHPRPPHHAASAASSCSFVAGGAKLASIE